MNLVVTTAMGNVCNLQCRLQLTNTSLHFINCLNNENTYILHLFFSLAKVIAK